MSDWFKVGEREPEQGEKVVVFGIDTITGEDYIAFGVYEDVDFIDIEQPGAAWNNTHWMPWPK